MEGLQELQSDDQLQGVVTGDSDGMDQGVEEGMARLRGIGIKGTAELKGSVAELLCMHYLVVLLQIVAIPPIASIVQSQLTTASTV
nr:hypothetical protein CFP56_27993 [Quercus suber]